MGNGISSFDDVIAKKPEPSLGGAMKETFLEFEREIVKRYVDVTISSIRSLDPHRLVFSNRLNVGSGETYARTLDLYGRYDGVAVNLFPANINPGLSETERLYLESIHGTTGRPLIISEWSVPAIDSGLYEKTALSPFLPPDLAPDLGWSWDEAVPTQRERAVQAARVDSSSRRANRGLFRASLDPWEELLDSLSGVHSLILGEKEGRPPEPLGRDQK